MKVTAILGSPRKNSVTTRIAKTFMDQAKETGAETALYFLNDMDFKGCQGCNVCKTKKNSAY